VVWWVVAVVAAAVFALPLVWMVVTSLKPESQALTNPPLPWPVPVGETGRFAAENYGGVWRDPVVDFPLYLRNTLIVALLSVTGATVSSAVIAYGLSRVRWRGRGVVFALVLATMMIPFPVLMAPLYVLYRELGWIGSFKPLWVPSWFGSAFAVFLLRQFFLSLPRELDEAARVDGLSRVGVFLRVVLPLSRPALTVVALLHFVFVWNDFLGPLIFLNDKDTFTLALGLQLFQSQAGNTPWSLLMAASTLTVAPVLLLFVLASKALMRGIGGASEGLREA
jgi:multiple sugar transport system permease protein